MSETPDERPRPTPRPRTAARPSPRPRVAGARREREEVEAGSPRVARPAPTPRPATREAAAAAPEVDLTKTGASASRPPRAARAARPAAAPATARRWPALALVLALLCVVAAAGAGLLFWQRLHPRYVDASVFSATRSGVQALYAFDYKDPAGSVRRKLDVLTGDLHDQYKTDLSQGGIIDTYKQVSATTSYEVLDVGLQQINDAQDTATVVVFGQYVVKSVNSGKQPAPQGSECKVTPDGAQSCTQTVQVGVVKVGGTWKINELTLLTTT
ncbi:MAG: hypothetical protein ACXVXT_11860 [Blastococcus sp.]